MLEPFGIKPDYWTDLTGDEKRHITNTLGAEDESDGDSDVVVPDCHQHQLFSHPNHISFNLSPRHFLPLPMLPTFLVQLCFRKPKRIQFGRRLWLKSFFPTPWLVLLPLTFINVLNFISSQVMSVDLTTSEEDDDPASNYPIQSCWFGLLSCLIGCIKFFEYTVSVCPAPRLRLCLQHSSQRTRSQ